MKITLSEDRRSIEVEVIAPLMNIDTKDSEGQSRGYMTMINPNVKKVVLNFRNELPDVNFRFLVEGLRVQE